MTAQNPIGDPQIVNYYQEYPTHYVQPYVYQPWQYTYPTQTRKKVVTEREFDTEGRVVKETITETTEPVYGWTASNGHSINVNVPGANIEANTPDSIIANINSHMKRSG